MDNVGRKASVVIGSAIASLIFAIVFIPGGGPVLFLPTAKLIKRINENQKKVSSREFSKELDKIKKKLEAKKRTPLTAFGHRES